MIFTNGALQMAPKKITKSKSRANIQHKSGKKWEIKSQKAQKPAVCCSNKGIRAILLKSWAKVGSGRAQSEKWGKFLSASLIFSFPYAHAHYIVVSSLCQVFCKQTTTKIVWYVRCNQCFTVYFIYRSGKFNNR